MNERTSIGPLAMATACYGLQKITQGWEHTVWVVLWFVYLVDWTICFVLDLLSG